MPKIASGRSEARSVTPRWRASGPHDLDGLVDERVEPNAHARDCQLAAVGTSQRQQSLHERLHARTGAMADLERLLIVGGRPLA